MLQKLRIVKRHIKISDLRHLVIQDGGSKLFHTRSQTSRVLDGALNPLSRLIYDSLVYVGLLVPVNFIFSVNVNFILPGTQNLRRGDIRLKRIELAVYLYWGICLYPIYTSLWVWVWALELLYDFTCLLWKRNSVLWFSIWSFLHVTDSLMWLNRSIFVILKYSFLFHLLVSSSKYVAGW